MADAQNIDAAAAQMEKFLSDLKGKAQTQAQADAANAEASKKAWQDIYASIPEGRMRTMTESVGVKASVDYAEEAERNAKAAFDRFTQAPVPAPIATMR